MSANAAEPYGTAQATMDESTAMHEMHKTKFQSYTAQVVAELQKNDMWVGVLPEEGETNTIVPCHQWGKKLYYRPAKGQLIIDYL